MVNKMKYDFETLVNRSNCGSYKWNAMKNINPDVSSDIVPFSVADMELKNAPEIMQGLREYLNDDSIILGYTGPTDSYYEAVIGWMKRIHNWNIKREWILQTPGVVPALYNLVNALTCEGDGVVIFTPVYYPFKGSIEQNNRCVIDVPLINENNYYYINYELLEAECKKDSTKLLIFCSPHNPIGRVWNKDELEKIVDICVKNNVLIISDEIHNDLVMDGYSHTVLATLSDVALNNSVICTAPSKTFNLAGLQCANVIIPNSSIREKYNNYVNKTAAFSLNIIGYKACEIAYTKCDKWYYELLSHIKENAEYVEEFINNNIPDIYVYTLEGTYLQWWDCRGLGLDFNALEEFVTKKANLYLDEGYIFGSNAKGFERINLACPRWVLEEALNRLLDAYKELKK